MIFQRYKFLFLILLVIGFLVGGCSQKRNTFTARQFHSLAAHYNGLYWANVNLDEAIYNIEKAHKDDYGKILPVFKYADDKAAKASFTQLNKAIEKTNKVIQYHSMLIDGKEHARWIDQNYLTLGRAHFYKRDYYQAVTVFEYIVKVFPEKSSKYDAFLWLVRSYNQMNSVIKTGPILDLLKHDKNLPGRLADEYQAVLSDYYLRTEQYKKAEESLMRAVSLTRKKTVRGRYWYILAQLCEQNGEFRKATDYYLRSAKLHPSYEMEFNARLARARTFQVENADTKELKKELHQMLRDAKNKEFLDQIYYALGDISYRENDIPSALDYFKRSAQNSLTNTRQKGISYLHIADIYFDRRDYKSAQAYYDSTIGFLPSDYKNYEQIKNKQQSLSSMIRDITTIAREDSLLKLSVMDTAALGKLIDGVIEQVAKDEEKKKAEQEAKAKQQQQANASGGLGASSLQAGGQPSGTWYFYNPGTISFGFSEFYKKWGNRPLEDNWRRINKAKVLVEQQADTAKQDTSHGPGKKVAENKTRKYYLKNIPFTDDQKSKSTQKIIDAYYDLGGIYKEDLQDNEKAAETFEELLKRYPDNKYALNLYYQLFRLYTAMKNTGRANFYKDKILNEYPDSEYAKIIRNPDYQKALLASRNEIEKYYSDTYSAYREGRYGEVIAMANKADTFYSASELMPKFALLRAYSVGKMNGAGEYEKALQGIVAKYPKADARAKAQELLDYLKKMKAAPVDTAIKKDTIKPSPYVYKDSVEHFCIIILSSKKIKINDFLVRVSDFNRDYFSTSGLNVSNVMMDMDHQIVMVKSFPFADKAKDYFDMINQDNKVFKDIAPEEYLVFPISADNFTAFYKEKNIPEYQKFFIENYKKKKKNE